MALQYTAPDEGDSYPAGEISFVPCLAKEDRFPCRLRQISECCFQGSGIESVHIPASVEDICGSAFENCEYLKGLYFSENSRLRTIHHAAFRHSGVRYFAAPKSLEEIDLEAFADCKELTSVTFSDGLQSVGPKIILRD